MANDERKEFTGNLLDGEQYPVLNESILRFLKGERQGDPSERKVLGIPLSDLEIVMAFVNGGKEKNPENKRGKFMDKMGEVYTEQFKQGYKFKTNAVVKDPIVPQTSLDNLVKKYKEKGFDVFVGERAFDIDGNEHFNMCPILLRKKEY